jgi:hypothetical protein
MRPSQLIVGLALAITLLVGGCGGGLSREEDEWCGANLDAVKRAISEERLRDYEYMDETWKQACRDAFARR